MVTIPANTGVINEVMVSIPVVDDLIDEPTDEGFLVAIVLESAMFSNLVFFDDVKSLTTARVLDNDGKK